MAGDFPLEFGYLCVEETQQGNGYGPALVEKSIQCRRAEGIFATVRVDNDRMHKILPANGFALTGVDYTSQRDPLRRLRLFIRHAG